MSANLPILWADKKNSPLLADFIAKYGAEYCMTAEEINQLRNAVNEMAAIQKTTFLGVAEPTDTPTGTGRGYWEVITPGTYTSFGGVVLGPDERGLIARDEAGAFKLSKAEFDFTTYAKKEETTIINLNLSKKVNLITGKNLFNKNNITSGYFADWTTGSLAANPPYSSSEFIEIKPNTNYSIRGTIQQSAWYDKNLVYLGGVMDWSISPKISPNNAKYTRLTLYTSEADTVQLEENSSATNYEPYYLKINQDELGFVANDANKINNIPLIPLAILDTPATSVNMLGAIGMVLSASVPDFNVVSIPFTDTRYVLEDTSVKDVVYTYCIIRSANTILEKHFKLYDGPKDYIFELNKIYSNKNNDMTIQVGTCTYDFKTIRFGLSVSTVLLDTNRIGSIKYLQASGSGVSIFDDLYTASPDYGGFNYKLYKIIDKIYVTEDSKIKDLPINFKFNIPNKLYLCSTKELWLYNENIFSNSLAVKKEESKLFYSADSNVYRLYSDRLILKAITNTADLQLLNSSQGISKIVLKKSVNVTAKVTPTGKTINVLVIGDSFIEYGNLYGEGIQTYIKNMAAADGNTIVYKGTRTYPVNSNPSEGRGGWSEYDYATLYVPLAQRNLAANNESKKHSSPFVFSPDDTVANSYFSFSKYITDNSIGQVDQVVFFLGMNGGNGTYINMMIANIKADFPNIKIFVSMIPTAPKTNYNGINYIEAIQSRELQNTNYLSLFDNRESELIYIVPSHFNVHNIYGIQNEEVNKFQFPDLHSEIETTNNGIHPTALGAKSIGYVLNNYLTFFS